MLMYAYYFMHDMTIVCLAGVQLLQEDGYSSCMEGACMGCIELFLQIYINYTYVRTIYQSPTHFSHQSAQLETRSRERESMGVESTDFDESRTPFQLQILARAQALEVTDA